MYWVFNGLVYEAWMDGTNSSIKAVTYVGSTINGMTIDLPSQLIYWTILSHLYIGRTYVNGTYIGKADIPANEEYRHNPTKLGVYVVCIFTFTLILEAHHIVA